MYSRMGNAILKEIRDYDKQEKGTRGSEMTPKGKNTLDHKEKKEYNRKYAARKQGNRLSVSISKLKKGLKSEWEKTKLQREHERMIENSLE